MSSSTSTANVTSTQHDHSSLHISPNEIAVGVIIGRVGEFFDFFVFGIACVLVFPGLFFPFATPLEGLYYSFAIFSFGFISRLPGALLFRIIHDRYGRAAKLTGSLLLLGTSTVTIAFLPGYAEIGQTAIVLLAVLRVIQGMAVAGAWDGLPSLLAVNVPREERGWYAMIAQIGAPIGFVVSTGLFMYLYHSVSAEDFIDWGWRFAFFTAFAINVVTLFARLRMAVTPEYEALFKAAELKPTPIGELLRLKSSNILLGACAPLACYALFHLVTIFPLCWPVLFPEVYSLDIIMLLQLMGALLCVGTMMISGKLANHIGRGWTLAYGAILIGLFTLPAPFLGDTVFGALAFIPAGFALLGFSLAQAAGAINSSFETQYRYSGALVTNELSWLLGAGFAPLVALWLSMEYGNGYVSLYLLSGVFASLIALKLNLERMKANDPD